MAGSNLDDLARNPQAAGLLKHQEALIGLAKSPDAQRLMELLNQEAGGGLKSAADAAAKGDAGALAGLVRQLMSSREGAELVSRIRGKLPRE